MFTNSIRSLLCRGYEPKHQEGHRVRNDLLGQNRSIYLPGLPLAAGIPLAWVRTAARTQ